MLVLVLASIACWAIIIEKFFRLRRLNRDLNHLESVATGGAAEDTKSRRGIATKLITAARDELGQGAALGEDRNDVRARLERSMRSEMKGHLQGVEIGLPFLATTGSAAPFIGLFGTVWGIMNSFTSIAQSADTSLAVVAPGIAEALFATALGLAAAIPAVVAYNQISVALGRGAARANGSLSKIAKAISSQQEPAQAGQQNVTPIHSGAAH
ncbi:MAG: MotA/TolQ/ExbB proton channel family protein [Alphaproteobacteria bacterium]|nr:MotA/TolQ/ExbB proton channel family protein [Alphaproteobacteria bacterium]